MIGEPEDYIEQSKNRKKVKNENENKIENKTPCFICKIYPINNEIFKKCSHCMNVSYCSLKCQKIDWKEKNHKLICKKKNKKKDLNILYHKINNKMIEKLHKDNYIIMDDFLGLNWSNDILNEMISLDKQNLMKPNTTQFNNGKEKILFTKPYITEMDLHDIKIREKANELRPFFYSNIIDTILNGDKTKNNNDNNNDNNNYYNNNITNRQTLKIQKINSNGGCFPCHYDNPGYPNKRQYTCLYYVNNNNNINKGGELVLYPFLKNPIVIQPLHDRFIIFKSDLILHRVLPCYFERYSLTIWLDYNNYNNNKTESFNNLIHKYNNNWFEFLNDLTISPFQRILSRAVYEEEYFESLHECINTNNTVNIKMKNILDSMIRSHYELIHNIKNNNFCDMIQSLREIKKELLNKIYI